MHIEKRLKLDIIIPMELYQLCYQFYAFMELYLYQENTAYIARIGSWNRQQLCKIQTISSFSEDCEYQNEEYKYYLAKNKSPVNVLFRVNEDGTRCDALVLDQSRIYMTQLLLESNLGSHFVIFNKVDHNSSFILFNLKKFCILHRRYR